MPAETAPPRNSLRRRVAGMYGLLAVLNLGAWAWAFLAFAGRPLLLSTALLAYGFGLRHAVDADHIAAIDNVTRKLMQEGRRPVAAGFFFALGHSAVVLIVAAAVAATATALQDRFEAMRSIGSLVGTGLSSAFLLLVAAMNLAILRGVWRAFRRVRAGGAYAEEEPAPMLSGCGPLARLLRPLFRLVSASWHMFPLGFLFGLGFDTATEVSLLGIGATQAVDGMPAWSILVFPALFAAGMALVDTTDGMLMLGAYGWAFVRPVRRLWYNLTITLVSVIVAVLIGGIEALGLIGGQLGLQGLFWGAIGALNDDLGSLGFVIVGVFVVVWAASAAIYRIKGYDRLDPPRAAA